MVLLLGANHSASCRIIIHDPIKALINTHHQRTKGGQGNVDVKDGPDCKGASSVSNNSNFISVVLILPTVCVI